MPTPEILSTEVKNQRMCQQWWHNRHEDAFRRLGLEDPERQETLTALMSDCWRAACRTPYEQPSLSAGREASLQEVIQWYAQTVYMGETYLVICHDTDQDRDFGLWPGPNATPADVAAVLDRHHPNLRVLRAIRADLPLIPQLQEQPDPQTPRVRSAAARLLGIVETAIAGMEEWEEEEVCRVLAAELARRLEAIRRRRWEE